MRNTLEQIEKQITTHLVEETKLNRFGMSDKYSDIFDEFISDVAINNADISLYKVAQKFKNALFFYNENHSEMVAVSPIFAYLFNLDKNSGFEKMKLDKWLSQSHWDSNLPIDGGKVQPALSYKAKFGTIPEFIAHLKVADDKSVSVHVLRCNHHKLNLDKDAAFIIDEQPMIFELKNTVPIHVVRYITEPHNVV